MNLLSTKIPLKVNKSKKTLHDKSVNTDFSFTPNDNIDFFIVNYDEFNPERTDIETDIDTLGTYIPTEDEEDNSFISGTENMNDQ